MNIHKNARLTPHGRAELSARSGPSAAPHAGWPARPPCPARPCSSGPPGARRRGHASPQARRHVHLHIDKQGLRRFANHLPLVELDTRLELPQDHPYFSGVDTTMSIDRSTHSLFGVSKTAADLLVQEYGRYFEMPTVCFGAGCVSGPTTRLSSCNAFLPTSSSRSATQTAGYSLSMRATCRKRARSGK